MYRFFYMGLRKLAHVYTLTRCSESMNNFFVSNKCILSVLTIKLFFLKKRTTKSQRFTRYDDKSQRNFLRKKVMKFHQILIKTIASHGEFELWVSRYKHVDHARATHQLTPKWGSLCSHRPCNLKQFLYACIVKNSRTHHTCIRVD